MKQFTNILLVIAIILATFTIFATATNQEHLLYLWETKSFQEPTPNAILKSQLNSEPLCPLTTKLEADASWSLNNAKIFSRLAAAAYCAPPSVKESKTKLDKWQCQACIDSGIQLTKVTPFSVITTDLYGFIGYNPHENTVVLSFTGSQSLVNWLYNLNAKFIDFPGVPGGQIHQGFYDAWTLSRPTVIAILDSYFYDHPSAKLSITGHSLGGAIATLATMDFGTAKRFEIFNFGPEGSEPIVFGNNLFDKIEFPTSLLGTSTSKYTGVYNLNGATYTFGAPRVGNKILADYFNSQLGQHSLFRTVHRADVVPHMPPLLLWPTAQHSTTEVFYSVESSTDDNFTICPLPETPTCSDQFPLPTSIDDHLNYLNYHLGTQPISAC